MKNMETIIDGSYVATAIINNDIAHWWVSGKNNSDTKLMFRYSHSVKDNDISPYLNKHWGIIKSLCDYTQGMDDISNDINELDKDTKAYVIESHLKNNVNNFDNSTKTTMTVDMYNLLKSFNFKQPQKAIAEFQSSLTGEQVKVVNIAQRLMYAKRMGYIKK
jgi:ABC-type dipeptide/oligopeptide/nickel transport system ATPase component